MTLFFHKLGATFAKFQLTKASSAYAYNQIIFIVYLRTKNE